MSTPTPPRAHDSGAAGATARPRRAPARTGGGLRLVEALLGILGGRSTVKRARAALGELAATYGDTGLAVAEVAPGLSAAVDQHAAAVRDGLVRGDRPLTPVALAGYARGVREAAAAYGWRVPLGPVDWTRADWVLTRLLAVCALSRTLPD